MRISGFTIVRNAIKFNYPVIASINSILPICDEFIVNVGDSQDGTLDLIKNIGDSKIRIIQTVWDMKQGSTVLSEQTNIALKECKGDWAFYLQTDEVIHEADLSVLRKLMAKNLHNTSVDALRFKWLHFYGSYWRYRIDAGWYQKQDRIIRNNGNIESYGDAFAFHRKDGKDLISLQTGCLLYHYGWVQTPQMMSDRKNNASDIGYATGQDNLSKTSHEYGDLNRFAVYFGTHPATMNQKIQEHLLSQQDSKEIYQKYWWNPLLWMRLRYKTGGRVKERII